MKLLLWLTVCFSVCALSTNGLSCTRDLKCTRFEEAFMFCTYGVVYGPCGLCQCAKGPGMECGGLFNLAGICGKGLFCARRDRQKFTVGICARW